MAFKTCLKGERTPLSNCKNCQRITLPLPWRTTAGWFNAAGRFHLDPPSKFCAAITRSDPTRIYQTSYFGRSGRAFSRGQKSSWLYGCWHEV